jgi:hypothetical protein
MKRGNLGAIIAQLICLDLLTAFITMGDYNRHPECKSAGNRESIPGRRRIWHV